MPKFVGKNKYAKLVINNLQKTPLDEFATMVVHGRCDEFLALVMKYLELEIPPFTLMRRVVVEYKVEKKSLQVVAVDIDETPATIFYAIEYGDNYLEEEPFVFDVVGDTFNSDINLYPMGHYKEQPFTINVSFNTGSDHQIVYDCVYNLEFGWNIQIVQLEQLINIIEVDYEAYYTTTDTSNETQPQRKSKDTVQTITTDTSKWHSVVPREDCPHVNDFIKNYEGITNGFKNNSCKTCGDKSENWYCLTCGDVLCSRYVQGHALKHFEDSGHAILVSFSDLSNWCYLCQDYISDIKIRPALFLLHKAKFGEPHPKDLDNQDQVISRFFCNQCMKPIDNVVYHCKVCDDYDLCKTCFKKEEYKEPHTLLHDVEKKTL